MNNSVSLICVKIIEWSLIAIIAVVPLMINPGAFDFWYRPKIESVYALLIIAAAAWVLLVLFRGRSCLWERSPMTIPLLCYVSAAILSTIFSIHVALSLAGDPLHRIPHGVASSKIPQAGNRLPGAGGTGIHRHGRGELTHPMFRKDQ